jgi:MFS family permease
LNEHAADEPICAPDGDVDEESHHLTVAIAMAIMGGYANGYMANMGIMFVKNLEADAGPMSGLTAGAVTGMPFLGGAVGCLLAGWLCNTWGRKQTSILGEILIVSSSILALLSPQPAWIIPCRTVTGLGIGICQSSKPIYVTELAPAEFRGRVLACFGLAFSAGIVTVKIIEHLLAGGTPGVAWRLNILIGVVPLSLSLSLPLSLLLILLSLSLSLQVSFLPFPCCSLSCYVFRSRRYFST